MTAALSQKGWQEQDGGDHRFFRLYVDGKVTRYMTKVSRGKKYKTLADPLVHEMARQMALTAKELHQFVECSISGPEYVRMLRERGKIEQATPKPPEKSKPGGRKPEKVESGDPE